MRATSLLRTASKVTADPWATHVGDSSELMAQIRKRLVVNPDSSTGNPIPTAMRWPQPASRPEKFSVPASKASDVAQNAYYERDFRRLYPKTEFVTQSELAELLLAQGGIDSLPAPAPASSTSLTTTEGEKQVPSLSSVYTGETAVAAATFKAPVPPGLKVEWFPALEAVPHDPNSFFPMYNASARVIAKI